MAGCKLSGDGSTSGSVSGSDQNPWVPPPTSPIEAENEIGIGEIESTPPPTNVETADTGKLVVCCEFSSVGNFFNF